MSEQAQAKITIWTQRLLRSKLHLPFFTAEVIPGPNGTIDYSASLNTIEQRPLCERQLNNHRAQRSQQADRLEFAISQGEFTFQLLSGKGCRWCAKQAGLLVRTESREEDWEQEDE